MITMFSVPMAVVQVIDVIVVLNRLVATVRAVGVFRVRMGLVFGVRHDLRLIPTRAAAQRAGCLSTAAGALGCCGRPQ